MVYDIGDVNEEFFLLCDTICFINRLNNEKNKKNEKNASDDFGWIEVGISFGLYIGLFIYLHLRLFLSFFSTFFLFSSMWETRAVFFPFSSRFWGLYPVVYSVL